MADGASPSDEAVRQAHARLLQDHDLQFDRVSFVLPKQPGWLKALAEFLEGVGRFLIEISPILKWVFWAGLATVVALILFAIIREVIRLRRPKARAQKASAAATVEWRPEAQTARDLLTEADTLAAQGRYADAAHLLLLRSVQDIEKRQPRALRVSLTTREIASLDSLPPAARPAFGLIGQVVERSLFGGSPVDQTDFSRCRQAYEDFALPQGWRG